MLSGMLGFIAVLVIVGGGIFVNNFKDLFWQILMALLKEHINMQGQQR